METSRNTQSPDRVRLLSASDARYAMAIAQAAHHKQTYGRFSYMEGHILPTLALARKYWDITGEHALPIEIEIGVLLHDTVEDTWVDQQFIDDEFGLQVGDIVWSVTDGEGATRAERKKHLFTRLNLVPKGKYVKCADRLHNANGNKLNMYQKEYPAFRENLKIDGEYDAIWHELDRAHGYVR